MVTSTLIAVHRWWRKRRDLAELRALEPRMLRDLGIDRSELVALVYGPRPDPTRRRRG